MKHTILLLLFIVISAAFADDITYGYLNVYVRSDDGTQCANEKVSITSGKLNFKFITNDAGIVSTIVPVGDVTAVTGKTTGNTVVTEGKTSTINLVIPRVGANILVVNPQENMTSSIIFSTYTLNDKVVRQPSTYNYGYRINLQIPPEAKDLTTFIRVNNLSSIKMPTCIYRRKWSFDTADPRRTIDFNVPSICAVTLKVVDEKGNPIADGTNISGKLSSNLTKVLTDGVLTDDEVRNIVNGIIFSGSDSTAVVNFYSVVKDGSITLPKCLSGMPYTIQLSTDSGIFSVINDMNISDDGKSDLTTYKLSKRKVEQTVYNSSGETAVNTNVFASYNQDGYIKVVSGKTDDKGIVIWENLPAVRITVWGDDVPVGIISANASVVTTMLPPPESRNVLCNIKTNVGRLTGTCMSTYFKDKSELIFNSYPFTTDSGIYLYLDKMASFYLSSSDDPSKVKGIRLYIPYCDNQPARNIIEVNDISPIFTANINIFNADGVTPATINNINLISGVIPKDMLAANDSLMEISRTEKGILLKTIMPGEYKLQIDALNENFAVVNIPSKDDITIKMPDSKVDLPPGAVVYWSEISNPSFVRCASARIDKDNPSFLFDSKKTYALWCRISPGTMLFWKDGLLKKRDMHTYNIRLMPETQELQMKNDVLYDDNQLWPLFPVTGINAFDKDISNNSVFTSRNITDNSGKIKLAGNQPVNLWPLKYYLRTGYGQKTAMLLNVNKDTPINIDVKRPDADISSVVKTTTLIVSFTPDDRKRTYSSYQSLYFDDDIAHMQTFYYSNFNFTAQMPENAKKITVIYPGFGMIKNVPLDITANRMKLRIEDLVPMATLKGKITDTAGVPLKNTMMYLSPIYILRNSNQLNISAITDIDGNYMFTNVPVGKYVLTQAYYSDPKKGLWLINIPDEKDCQVNCVYNENPSIMRVSMLKDLRQLWWIEDGKDKAIQLPFNGDITGSHEIALNSGYLFSYSVDEFGTPAAYYNRVIINKQNQNYISMNKTALLTLLAPLKENGVYPDVINISGTGVWQDIRLNISVKWAFYSGLDCAMTSFSGLAPGKWNFSFTDSTGKVAEQQITIGTTDQSVDLRF